MDTEKIAKELQELYQLRNDLENKLNKMNNKISTIEKLLEANYEYEIGLEREFIEVDAFTSFLQSESVTLGPNLYCRQKVFIVAFKHYCNENHLRRRKLNFYHKQLVDFGLKVLMNARKKYPNTDKSKSYTETFIMGVDVKNLPESESENENESD